MNKSMLLMFGHYKEQSNKNYVYKQRWARVRLDGGGVILEIFMVGGSKHFYDGGMVGGG